MFLNICVKRGYLVNCYERLLASVALWLERHHEMMFTGYWGFGFSNPDPALVTNTLGLRLQPAMSECTELLERYHGIKVLSLEKNSTEEILNVIYRQLELGLPVTAIMDEYYCRWCIGYNNRHTTHSCLIAGIEGNELLCLDFTYRSNTIGRLSIEGFKEGCVSYSIFDVKQHSGDTDWRAVLSAAANRLLSMNSFDAMREFAKEVKLLPNLTSEVQRYSDYMSAPLFVKLWELRKGRANFTTALRYIAAYYGAQELLECAARLEIAGKKWEIIRYMLLKECYSTSNTELIISAGEMIEGVASQEEGIAHSLLR